MYIFIYNLELSKYLERKEELESRKIKQQHKECIQSLGTSKNHIISTERKKKLELPENGNKINLLSRCIIIFNYFT